MTVNIVFIHGIWDSGRSFTLFQQLAAERH